MCILLHKTQYEYRIKAIESKNPVSNWILKGIELFIESEYSFYSMNCRGSYHYFISESSTDSNMATRKHNTKYNTDIQTEKHTNNKTGIITYNFTLWILFTVTFPVS